MVLGVGGQAEETGNPAQHPSGRGAQVPTTTRTVAQFTALETNLADALRRHDESAASALLADDFELRTAAAPGTPVPRADWLRAALRSAGREFSIQQMAVHMFGDTAAVSFLLSGKTNSGRNTMVVDVWTKVQNDWKLAVRYSSPSSAQAALLPSGKQ
jgi:ketosteroid isomerase-like protein